MLLSACSCFLLKNYPPNLSIFYDGLSVPYLTNPHPQPSGLFSRILVPSPLTCSLILGFPYAGHGLTLAVIFYLQHSVDKALEIAFLGPRGPPSTAFQCSLTLGVILSVLLFSQRRLPHQDGGHCGPRKVLCHKPWPLQTLSPSSTWPWPSSHTSAFPHIPSPDHLIPTLSPPKPQPPWVTEFPEEAVGLGGVPASSGLDLQLY